MTVRSITIWYGVCDRCGDEDDDGRPSEHEARNRMWPGTDGQDWCWECADSDGSQETAPSEAVPDAH